MSDAAARVLVVDDNEDVRELLQELLESAGYAVSVAADGEAAIALFAIQPAQVVITDVRMPKRNGLQVLQAVLAARPGTPVIMLTGQSAGDDDEYEARQLGAFACLTKPLRDIHMLSALVAEAISSEQ